MICHCVSELKEKKTYSLNPSFTYHSLWSILQTWQGTKANPGSFYSRVPNIRGVPNKSRRETHPIKNKISSCFIRNSRVLERKTFYIMHEVFFSKTSFHNPLIKDQSLLYVHFKIKYKQPIFTFFLPVIPFYWNFSVRLFTFGRLSLVACLIRSVICESTSVMGEKIGVKIASIDFTILII